MSFLLVDRITEFVPGLRASGQLVIPDDVPDFPLSLVVEAVGQLAAYVAMESTDFSMRPVAAIAGEVVSARAIAPGDQVALSIEVRALRGTAMRYGGLARVGGRTAVELHRCTGAMLPMDAFDDPENVRRQLRMLKAGGAPARRFPSRAEFAPDVTETRSEVPGRLSATLVAPAQAAFYADHFPRRPVYPATLLLDAKIAIAQNLIGRTRPDGAAPPAIRAVHSVKVRAFTPPGGRVEVVTEEIDTAPEDSGRLVRMEAFAQGERVSTASVLLEA